MSLQNTPAANRLHIAILGKRNAGKSSLLNALVGQDIALVSDVPGTTTDPVYKAMEVHPIGPCMFIDTAGFDDEGELGNMRVAATRKALERADLAILVVSSESTGTLENEKEWAKLLNDRNLPIIGIINKSEGMSQMKIDILVEKAREACNLPFIEVNALKKIGIEKIREEIVRKLPEDFEAESITRDLVQAGDVVLLVMPQDIQAPKGRLILPQVQTIRELLDKKAIIVSTTTEKMEEALKALSKAPKLIIVDSQIFAQVYEKKPQESLLTSFSVLFAAYKGDIDLFVKGAEAIEKLTESSKVLIAEACTHAPLSEDIGRVKIPQLLRKRVGQNLEIDIVSGASFPKDLSDYDLVIHCGGCMFNRRMVLNRAMQAIEQGVPITNYGIIIAKISGILDKINY